MSNLGLTLFAEKESIDLEITAVGDRYVLEVMREKGFNLGGEQSGHVIFLDDNTTGDGMLSALRLMESYAEAKVPMSKLTSIMKALPQVLINVKIDNTKKSLLENTTEIWDAIDEVEKRYHGRGRVLVRPSGTEPKIKFYFSVNTPLVSADKLEETEKSLDERISGIIEDMKLG